MTEPRNRFGVINAFIDRQMTSLPRAAALMWLCLWRDTRSNGLARTSHSHICRRIGCDRQTVSRSLKTLKERGLVKVVARGNLMRGPSLYRVFSNSGTASAKCPGVYVVSAGGSRHKVGRARNIAKRLASMQTGCPESLQLSAFVECSDLSAVKSIEAAVHEKLAQCRIHGEWFSVSKEAVVSALMEAAGGLDVQSLDAADLQPKAVPSEKPVRA